MPTFHLFPIQWGYKPQRRQQALLWLSILGAICGLTILQDYLQAQRNGYGFYLSESALFKVSWLLFMPVAGLLLPFGGKRASAKLPHTLHTVAFVSMATALHILLFAAAVSGLSALLFDHTYTPGKLISYTVSEDLYKYILVYTALALTALPRRSATAQPAPESPATAPTLAAIIVANGTQQTVLPTNSIHFITAASPYIAIHTAHKKYLHTCTLKTIEGQLDGQVFVRIHKSSIVNLRQVAHCRSRLNGDYDLVLHNGQQLRLSRHYVAAFRQRFGNG